MLTNLEIARNPLRSDEVRREAWDRDCAEFWLRSHLDRGLPFGDIPRESQERVRVLLFDRQCNPEALCKSL
jgi:hypothetical protein